MNVANDHCCGLDIHKKTISACAIVPGPDGAPQKTIRQFGTMTDDLEALADWLTALGVTHVAMESTGIFWKPIYNVLEDRFTLLLANARYIKSVPGRKTDIRDSEWIADCHRHGLLKASFVPERAQREVRELTRYRTSLVDERSAEVNRLQKTLEGANIKLSSVASDVMGKSGREMVEELVAGSKDRAAMADLAKGTLRNKIPQLERALEGQFGPHQRFLVAQQLAHIDALDEILARLDAEVAERVRPLEGAIELLDTIPGFGRRNAENLLAEIGPDMSRFPTAHHLASWARMCPGMEESAGKRKSGVTGHGNPWLRRLLVEAAHAAGHSQLVIAWHMLKIPAPYADLGPNYFDERSADRLERRLVGRLNKLGYEVVLTRKAA